MDEYKEGICFGCRESKKVRHKNLYPSGSEGCKLCIECELALVRFLTDMALSAMTKKKEEFKRRKREEGRIV